MQPPFNFVWLRPCTASILRPVESGGRGDKCPGARRSLLARQGPGGLQSIYDEYNNFNQFKLQPHLKTSRIWERYQQGPNWRINISKMYSAKFQSECHHPLQDSTNLGQWLRPIWQAKFGGELGYAHRPQLGTQIWGPLGQEDVCPNFALTVVKIVFNNLGNFRAKTNPLKPRSCPKRPFLKSLGPDSSSDCAGTFE